MNRLILKALIWEEWARVRTWLPWVFAALSLDTACIFGFGFAANFGARWTVSAVADNVVQVLVLFVFAAIFFSTVTIGTNMHGRTLSAELPSRYFTLPVSAWQVLLTQLACRMVFVCSILLGPLAVYFYFMTPYQRQFLESWVTWPFIVVAGMTASNAWWRKIGKLSLGIWIALPVVVWAFGLTQMHWSNYYQTYDSRHESVIGFIGRWIAVLGDYFREFANGLRGHNALQFSLFGVATGALALRWGGAFESVTLPQFTAIHSRNNYHESRPFKNTRAAIVWAEASGGIWWPTVFALGIGTLLAMNIFGEGMHWRSAIRWIPTTPWWIISAANAQEGLAQVFFHAFTLFPMSLLIMTVLKGLGFLGRNFFREPFVMRLPISADYFGCYASWAVFKHLAVASGLGLAIIVGGHTLFSGRIIGAQYLAHTREAPNTESEFNRLPLSDILKYSFPGHTESGPAIEEVSNSNTLRVACIAWFWLLLMAWMAFWPVCWVLYSMSMSAPMDLVALISIAGASTFQSVTTRRRWAAAVSFIIVLATLGAIAYWAMNREWNVVQLGVLGSMRVEPRQHTNIRLALEVLAFFAAPPATLAAITRLRRLL